MAVKSFIGLAPVGFVKIFIGLAPELESRVSDFRVMYLELSTARAQCYKTFFVVIFMIS
jgi:hypothetical protein